jgi:chromate transporter
MTEPRTTWGLVRYFLYLGSLGFGGPVALIGYMQRDLVERRRWFSKDDYVKGLALSQLAVRRHLERLITEYVEKGVTP